MRNPVADTFIGVLARKNVRDAVAALIVRHSVVRLIRRTVRGGYFRFRDDGIGLIGDGAYQGTVEYLRVGCFRREANRKQKTSKERNANLFHLTPP